MIYRFLELALDDQTLELRAPDGPVAVEPRVLETLIYLVQHRDRVVSKDELATEVWGASHVTDAALARSIKEARRAVRRNGKAEQAIRTVYGRGYHFVATVTCEATPEAPTVEQPTRPRRRFPLLWLAAGLLALAAAGAAYRLNRQPEGLPTPVRIALPPSAVAGAEEGSDTELLLVSLSLNELLQTRLAEQSAIELVNPDAGEGEGGAEPHYILETVLTPATAEGRALYRATLREVDSPGARRTVQLGEFHIPYLMAGTDLAPFTTVRDAVVEQLAQLLVITLEPNPRSQGGDESPEVIRLLLSAAARHFGAACRYGETARELVRRALEIDPRSAAAWYQLANTEVTLANVCATGDADLRTAQDALNRAKALAPAWDLALQLEAVILLRNNETEAAYALLMDALERFPESLSLRYRRSETLRYAGFLAQSAAAFERLAAENPGLLSFVDLVPYPAFYAGAWDRFLAETAGRETPYYRYYQGFAEAMRGEPDAAATVLAPAFRQHPGDLFARLSQALLAAVEGRPEEARVMLDQLVEQRAARETGDGEVTYKLAQLYLLAGREEAALAQLARTIDEGFFCTPCIRDDVLFAPLAGNPSFDALLARATARHRAFGQRFGLAPEI